MYVHSLSGAVENENSPSSANRHSLKKLHELRVSFARTFAWNSIDGDLEAGPREDALHEAMALRHLVDHVEDLAIEQPEVAGVRRNLDAASSTA